MARGKIADCKNPVCPDARRDLDGARYCQSCIDQIIDRCARGDPDAQQELFGDYKTHVFALAFRLLRNQEDAAEATNETLLRVLNSLQKKPDKPDKFDAFLNTVCRHECFRLFNKRKLRPDRTNVEDFVFDGLRAAESDASGLSAAIDALPEDLQRIIKMKMAGFTFDEIAIEVGRAKSHVHKQWRNALDRLRQSLESVGDSYGDPGPRCLSDPAIDDPPLELGLQADYVQDLKLPAGSKDVVIKILLNLLSPGVPAEFLHGSVQPVHDKQSAPKVVFEGTDNECLQLPLTGHGAIEVKLLIQVPALCTPDCYPYVIAFRAQDNSNRQCQCSINGNRTLDLSLKTVAFEGDSP